MTKESSPHNHEPVNHDFKIRESLQNLKQKAKSSLTPMPTLFDDAVMSLKNGEAWTDESRSVVEAMPTFHAKKDTLHRARRYHHFLHTEETSSSQTSFRPSKILGFSTTSNLRFLCAGDTIYGDGTFYVTPRLFYQLYTLQPFVANKMVPLVFLLLPDKKKETYDRAFRLVKDAAEN